MKAVLLHEYGGVDKLQYQDWPDPVAAPGEVLVRVISTSINPIDYKIRSGVMKERVVLKLPVILGRDLAGDVVALGDGVTKFKVGDQVMGFVSNTYAEYVAAAAEALTKIPEGLDPKDAGVLPLIVLTGAQLIEKGVQPKSGETVLVTGALGSVGRTAVFLAKQQGADVIAGVRSKQLAEAQSLGVGSVVAIDDDHAIASLPELDAIADTVGRETLVTLLPKLKKSGRLGSLFGKPEAAEKAGIDVRQVYAQPDTERLHQLAEDVRDGRLTIPIATRFPLSEIRQAQVDAEQGANGKIEIIP